MAYPKLSVIVPAFNVAAFIAEAIASVRAQTLSDFEIIVIDDGSTDGTLEIVEEIQAKDAPDAQPIVLLKQRNRGQNVARNLGLGAARGDYIAFLDGDDRWLPRKLERHAAMLDARPDLDLTYSSYRFINDAGQEIGIGPRGHAGALSFSDLVRQAGGIRSTSLLVARRTAIEAVGGFDEQLGTNTDVDFCIQIATLRPNNIGYIPEMLVDYRIRSGQVSSATHLHPADWERVIEKARRHDPNLVARLEHVSRANKALSLAHIAYARGDYAAARRLFRRALRASPRTVLRNGRSLRRAVQFFLLPMLPPRVHQQLFFAGRRLRGRLSPAVVQPGSNSVSKVSPMPLKDGMATPASYAAVANKSAADPQAEQPPDVCESAKAAVPGVSHFC